MKLQLFKKFNEKYDFNKLSDEELDKVKDNLVESLENIKLGILENIFYDTKLNKIKFTDDFKNISVENLLEKLTEEFGIDVIRELNVEALFRKISQIIILKKRSTRRRIKEEFSSYINSLDARIKRQKETLSDDEHFDKAEGEWSILPRKKYEGEKYDLQVELLKLQEWVVKNNKRVAIVFEGRDAAGKGSTIKRFVKGSKYYKQW